MTGSQSQDMGTWLPQWDGAAYAANTAHHRRYDDAYLSTLPLRPHDSVLDLGCGAGDFTAVIAALVPGGSVVGVDPQASMLDEARRRAGPNQRFVQATAQSLDGVLDEAAFDVVSSRAVLHWVPAGDHPAVLAQCRRALRPGGVLRIECGGGDNVREVVTYLDGLAAEVAGEDAPTAPWTFFGAGAYLDLLLEAGFSVEDGFARTVAQRRAFDRESVLGWMTSQTLQAYDVGLSPPVRAEFRRRAEERIDALRRSDGSYDLTFVRLDVLARAV